MQWATEWFCNFECSSRKDKGNMASNYVNSPELSDFSQEPRAAGFGTASKHGTASEGSSNVQARVSFVFWCLWVPNWKNIHIMPTCLYVLLYTHYPPWLTLGWQRVSKNTYAQAHTHMYVYTHSPWQPFRHVSITPRDFFRQWSLSRAGTVVCLCVPSMRRSLSCLRVTVRSMRSEANRFSSWKKGKRLFLSARRTVSALLYVFSSFKVVWRSRCRFSWSTTIFIGCLQVSSLTSPLPGRAWTLLGMAFWSGRWIPNAHPSPDDPRVWGVAVLSIWGAVSGQLQLQLDFDFPTTDQGYEKTTIHTYIYI